MIGPAHESVLFAVSRIDGLCFISVVIRDMFQPGFVYTWLLDFSRHPESRAGRIVLVGLLYVIFV